MSAEHTPTPWLIDEDVFDEDEIEITSQDRLDNSMCGIATIQVGGFNEDVEAQKRADAAFIVRSANCHDDLVAALRSVRKNIPEGAGTAFMIIDAALAKAAQS